MMAVELARLRCAEGGESTFRVPGKDRAVFRRIASAAEAASAVRAAAVEPAGPTPPASIAPTGASAGLHVQAGAIVA
jgi:hypothetical protein